MLSWLLEEVPLKGPARAETIGQSFAMPHDATSLQELEQIATQLLRRENRWQAYERIAAASGVTLAPDEIWLLVRLSTADTPVHLGDLAVRFKLPIERLEEIAARLVAKSMAERNQPARSQRRLVDATRSS